MNRPLSRFLIGFLLAISSPCHAAAAGKNNEKENPNEENQRDDT